MDFFLIATPIGNLEDISIRSLKTISQLRFLAVEDTRQTAKLLQLLQVRFPQYRLWPKQLLRCDRYTERLLADRILALLKGKQSVGLLTDAGMPSVADPGNYLVRLLQKNGVNLQLLPGPSALTAALSLCGFEAEITLFIGFWPKKPNSILKTLRLIKSNRSGRDLNLVFFESPLRIHKTCQQLGQIFPKARFFLARELTKKFQTLYWFTALDLANQALEPKGEYTAVINF